jgi:hypothetical protein
LLLALLFFAGAITIFLSPAIFTGRYLSPASLLISNQPWAAQPPPGWTGASNPILRDVITAFDPWRQYAGARLRAGHLPLWNPDNMLGAPFIGNAQTAVFYPGNWLNYIWPGGFANLAQAWLKLLFAALGTYLFARQIMRVGPIAATIAALTFCFASYMVVWLLYGLSDAALWLPWVWWASGRLVARPSPGWAAALAVMAALSLLSGHFETSYHIALVSGPIAIFEAFRAGQLQVRRIAAVLAAWGGAYALGARLAAIQLLPFIDYLNNSVIKLVRTDRAGPESVPWFYAWTMFSPRLFGSPQAACDHLHCQSRPQGCILTRRPA